MRLLVFLAPIIFVLCACDQSATHDQPNSSAAPASSAEVSTFDPFNCGANYPRVTVNGSGAQEITLTIPDSLRQPDDEGFEAGYFARRGILSNGTLAFAGLPVIAFERVVEFDVSVDWVLIDAPVPRVLSEVASAVGGDVERFRLQAYYWPMATGEDGPSSSHIYFVDLASGADVPTLRRYLGNEESDTASRGPLFYEFPINTSVLPGDASPYPGRLIVLSYGDDRTLLGCHYQPS